VKVKAIVATTAVILLGFAPYVSAQSLATGKAAEPLTGLVLGLGLLGLRFLSRR